MKILLLGGTGAMGAHLSSLLLERGDEVHVTTRKERISDNPRLVYHKGNAHNEQFLNTILCKHYDAIVDFMVYTTEEFRAKVDRLLTSSSQYLYMSSCRVFANSEVSITENTPLLLDVSDDQDFLKTDEYALTKARQERILQEKKGYTIVRPYITYSDNRLQLGVWEKDYWLYPIVQGRSLVFSEDILHHKTTLTYGYDVAKAICIVLGNPLAQEQSYNITTTEYATWEEIKDIYLQTLDTEFGIRPRVVIIPKAHQLKTRDVYQVKYDRCFDRVFDNSKIMSLNPDLSFVPLRQGLSDNLSKCIRNNNFLVLSNRICIDRDKDAHEFMKRAEFSCNRIYLKYLLQRFLPAVFDPVINRI